MTTYLKLNNALKIFFNSLPKPLLIAAWTILAKRIVYPSICRRNVHTYKKQSRFYKLFAQTSSAKIWPKPETCTKTKKKLIPSKTRCYILQEKEILPFEKTKYVDQGSYKRRSSSKFSLSVNEMTVHSGGRSVSNGCRSRGCFHVVWDQETCWKYSTH